MRRTLCFLLASAATATSLNADQLPVKTYATKDGLASTFVHRIRRDSRGFLWFATREGLSRFDGARFVSYSISDGLPDASVYDIVEADDGTYWVATNGGGVSRFNPAAARQRGPLFTTYEVGRSVQSNRVNHLFQDSAGTIWAGTDGGIFRLEKSGADETFRPVTFGQTTTALVHGGRAFAEDADGHLWIATNHGLVRRMPGGRSMHYSLNPRPDGTDNVYDVRVDREGRLWIGGDDGLFVFKPERASELTTLPAASRALKDAAARAAAKRAGPWPDRPGEVRRYTSADGLPDGLVIASVELSGGQIWVATRTNGLFRWEGSGFRGYAEPVLRDSVVGSLVEDADRHLWIGTQTGAHKLVLDGFTSYGPRDGLPPDVRSIHEDQRGRLYAVSGPWAISRVEQDRVVVMQPELPRGLDRVWASPAAFLDREGGWWLLTTSGLYRLPNSERFAKASRQATPFAPADPFREGVFKLFEDTAGDLWIGLRRANGGSLARWNRTANQLYTFTAHDGWPDGFMPSAFVEDQLGSIWFGSYYGGLARYRQGRFTLWTAADGIPAGFVTALHRARDGRIWVATSKQGVSRIDQTEADVPRFVSYTIKQGLISNNVRCITEDESGRLYLGTGRGLDRFDPATGYVKHFNTSDGLAGEFVVAAHRDRSGSFWFATLEGLSRYVPRQDEVIVPPRVYLSGVSLSGVAQPLSAIGETELADMTLRPDQNHIAIDFFALGPRVQDLRYQYRLSSDATWIDSPARTVRLAAMAPGSYRFEVRALAEDGFTGSQPAVVAFTILPPFYARWWFASLVMVALGAIGYVAYRVRVSRLLDLERVRSRIATDLHDDIGASLSQIAMVSEVARQQIGPDGAGVRERLESIASTSRDLVDSLSDVVWAINPERDSLSDLVHRMRRFANDVVTTADIEMVFHGPPESQRLRLGADVRRELFLIFKEAINNCARHSACTRVEVDFDVARQGLRLRVADNGRGFDPVTAGHGNGLANMRRRGEALGGTLAVTSAPGQGTILELAAPVEGARRPAHYYLFRRRPDPGRAATVSDHDE